MQVLLPYGLGRLCCWQSGNPVLIPRFVFACGWEVQVRSRFLC